MKLLVIVLVEILVASFAVQTFAGAVEGKAKSASCVACHGADGVSLNPLWPNLAKQKKEYLKKQMLDFKEGRRKDPLMSPMSMALTPQDMEDLAEYFSSL